MRLATFPRLSRIALAQFSPQPRKAVLVIGDSGYRLLLLRGRTIVESHLWPRDGESRDRILDYLHRLDSHHLTVLVDSMEQTYRREEIPAASMIDRRRIVDRRLDIAFPATPLKLALRLAQERKGKSDHERYLFASLPDNEEIRAWIDGLYDLDYPLGGIGLLPLEVAARAAGLQRLMNGQDAGKARASGWTLVVGREQTGGIRQIVLHDNDLALTRLATTPADDLPVDMTAMQVQRDIQSTIGYLSRLGYERGTHVSILVIADMAVREALLALPPPPGDVSMVVRTPDEALDLLGFRAEELGPGQPWADPVFAALVVDSGLARPLATPAMERTRRARLMARNSQMVAAAIAAGLVLFTGYTIKLKLDEDAAAALIEQQRRGLVATLDQRRDELASHPMDVEVLRKVMRGHDYLGSIQQDYAVTTARIVRELGEEVRLSEISWKRVNGGGDRRSRNGAREASLPPVDGDRPLAIDMTLDMSRLTGIEQAIAATTAIAGRLQQSFDGYSATVLQHVVDILPGQALQGDTGARSLDQVTRSGMYARILLARSPS